MIRTMAQFQLTKEEYVSACTSMQFGKLIKTSALLIFALILICISQIIYGRWIVLVPVALVVIGYAAGIYLSRKKIAKAYDDQKDTHEAIEAIFSEEGIVIKFFSGSTNTGWNRILKWKENRNFLYLFQSDFFASIIPKRALSDDESELIYRHLKSVKKAK